MATDEKKSPNNGKAVSPLSGAPTPRGRPFTTSTARSARQKRTEKERKQKSITQAFLNLIAEEHTDGNGKTMYGNEIIANAILKYAARGNPKLIELALALTGETPTQKVELSNGQLADLIEGLKEPPEAL